MKFPPLTFFLFFLAISIHSSAYAVKAVQIDTVFVGNAGNANDSTGYGGVDYDYRISKYEVTVSQYTEFLNAVDPTGDNQLGLFNSGMTQALGRMTFEAGGADGEKYLAQPGLGQTPIAHIDWYDTLRFANWMNNGQGSGDTETGAYTLLGGTPIPSNALTITRNSDARWFLPSENEWYKAAYQKNDGVTGNYWNYPTGTDVIPSSAPPGSTDVPDPTNVANFYRDDEIEGNGFNDGFALTGTLDFSWTADPMPQYFTDVGAYSQSVSPYGTFDQGGNVWEWNESLVPEDPRFPWFPGFRRGRRGGNYGSSFLDGELLLHAAYGSQDYAGHEHEKTGFRLAAIASLYDSPDFNDNGIVEGDDLLVWQQGFGLDSGALHSNGDANENGVVDGTDFLAWQQEFIDMSGAPADFNENGEINFSDFLIWQYNYGLDSGAVHTDGDSNKDGKVDGFDFLTWQLAAPVPEAPTANFNGDGTVDNLDLQIWQQSFGLASGALHPDGDANENGAVDGTDFLAWQRSVPPSKPSTILPLSVPEPSSASLLAVSLFSLAVTYSKMRGKRNLDRR